jgi:hypothetical protein
LRTPKCHLRLSPIHAKIKGYSRQFRYALSLPLLFGSYYISWSFFVFPVWVALISIFIIVDNLRRRPATGD